MFHNLIVVLGICAASLETKILSLQIALSFFIWKFKIY